MVFYYVARGDYHIYMGRDKFENEKLIEWGWPEDVWFHVDDLSSAHVYLRMKPGDTIDTIPEEALYDCCQLVKANSIKGCKLASAKIVYTRWDNLHKRANMDVGTIGFHDNKQLRYYMVEKKDKECVKRLERGKTEVESPDFAAERRQRDEEEIQRRKEEARIAHELEQLQLEQARKQKDERSYSSLFAGLEAEKQREAEQKALKAAKKSKKSKKDKKDKKAKKDKKDKKDKKKKKKKAAESDEGGAGAGGGGAAAAGAGGSTAAHDAGDGVGDSSSVSYGGGDGDLDDLFGGGDLDAAVEWEDDFL